MACVCPARLKGDVVVPPAPQQEVAGPLGATSLGAGFPLPRRTVCFRCLCEPGHDTSTPVVFRWCSGPAASCSTGICREWEGDRGTEKVPNIGNCLLLLYSFLTTSRMAWSEPIHDKAMPVPLTTQAEAEQWLEAPLKEALPLQNPATDDAIALLPERKKAV